MPPFPQIIFIIGPTAIGKSEVAYLLAKKLKGEIISCDSMQVYRELTIVVNKPSGDVLKKVPHHLIDIVGVEDDFDVARFNQMACEHIRMIHKKNRIPIIVGGSMMYVMVLLDGIFKEKAKDGNLREQLKNEAEEKGVKHLYDKLKNVDPQTAQKIHPNDLRRIIRALEVFTLEGKPLAQLQKQREGLWGNYDISIFVLNMPRKELYERIDRRVEKMFEAGLVEEIKKLKEYRLNRTAQQTIGIKEVRGFIEGEYDLERAKYLMKLHTRHYAKRQLTWLRKDKRFRWVDISSQEKGEDIVRKIISGLDKS